MLNYNGDVNHSQQVRHGAVVMFLTTHSVFEQLLLYDERERAERRGTVPGSARRGAGVAGRAHKELTDTRVRCARVCCVARVLGVVRAARRAAASAVPSADVHRAVARRR